MQEIFVLIRFMSIILLCFGMEVGISFDDSPAPIAPQRYDDLDNLPLETFGPSNFSKEEFLGVVEGEEDLDVLDDEEIEVLDIADDEQENIISNVKKKSFIQSGKSSRKTEKIQKKGQNISSKGIPQKKRDISSIKKTTKKRSYISKDRNGNKRQGNYSKGNDRKKKSTQVVRKRSLKKVKGVAVKARRKSSLRSDKAKTVERKRRGFKTSKPSSRIVNAKGTKRRRVATSKGKKIVSKRQIHKVNKRKGFAKKSIAKKPARRGVTKSQTSGAVVKKQMRKLNKKKGLAKSAVRKTASKKVVRGRKGVVTKNSAQRSFKSPVRKVVTKHQRVVKKGSTKGVVTKTSKRVEEKRSQDIVSKVRGQNSKRGLSKRVRRGDRRPASLGAPIVIQNPELQNKKK